MQEEPLALYFIFSGTALVLLFVVAVWQRARMTSLEKHLDRASRAVAQKNDTPAGPTLVSQLREAPFPLCHTDLEGKIVGASRSFYQLVGKDVQTLADVAKNTGAQLASDTAHRHERVVLRSAGSELLRHFSLVAWPVAGKHGPLGMMYALLEHTSSVRQSQHQHSFEQEVLTLQEELLKSLGEETQNLATVQELASLTAFLKEQHHPHPQRTFEQFDVVSVIRDALEEYRPFYRQRTIAVTATLPTRAMVIGYAPETAQIVQLLLAAVAEHADARSTVRLHVGKRGKYVELTVSLPELHPAMGAMNDIFSFGSRANRRQSQVRLALARLLLGRQNGNLVLTVDDEGTAIAQVSFLAGKA